MENKIYNVSREEAFKIVANCKNDKIYVGELYGHEILSREDYYKAISTAFKFPTDVIKTFDAYLDRITDLDWLIYHKGSAGFCVVIYDFGKFMSDDLEFRHKILETFKRVILPFWEEDITKTRCIGEDAITGEFIYDKPREFNVYLIN